MKQLNSRSGYIFIDADDTLWENEQYFRDAEAEFAQLVAPGSDVGEIQKLLWEKQEINIPWFGYGSKTYFIGMTSAALKLCGGHIPEDIYEGIRQIIIRLSHHEVNLIPGVAETLAELSKHYKLVLATKGETMEQIEKINASGLADYFVAKEVMLNKAEKDYLELAKKFGVEPEDVIMIGNSVKSDIIPVLNIGGTAIHIPHEIVWTHELADLPESDNLIQINNFADLCLKLPK